MHIHIHIHYDGPKVDELAQIRESLTLIKNKLFKMADDQKAAFDALAERFNNATNSIAAQIKQLRDEIKGTGIPKDQEDSFLARMDGIATQLEAVGKPEELPVS